MIQKNFMKTRHHRPRTAKLKSSHFGGPVCPNCAKPLEPTSLCVCELAKPIQSKHKVLILQHPQEPDKVLGTAKMAQLMIPDSKLVIGLSWPNLTKAYGSEITNPKEWAVLYLGSGLASGSKKPENQKSSVIAVDKKGTPLSEEHQSKLPETIKGIVVIDGTWSQAKAIWWRNAWLLKLQRIVIIPKAKGLYQELRREPKPEAVSTIESLAEVLNGLGNPESETLKLKEALKGHLAAFREYQKANRTKPS